MTKFACSITVLLALCTVTLSGKPVGEKPEKQLDYYPLGVGTKWHLQLDVNGRMLTMVSQIAKIETIDQIRLARLEVAVQGQAVTVTEHLSTSDKGIFRHRTNGLEMDPPLCMLKYPIKEGETWRTKTKVGPQVLPIECIVGKWEQVEVPAGKFKAIKVNITTEEAGQPIVTDYWFAAGVGVVKQTADFGGLKIVTRLEKFEPGK